MLTKKSLDADLARGAVRTEGPRDAPRGRGGRPGQVNLADAVRRRAARLRGLFKVFVGQPRVTHEAAGAAGHRRRGAALPAPGPAGGASSMGADRGRSDRTPRGPCKHLGLAGACRRAGSRFPRPAARPGRDTAVGRAVLDRPHEGRHAPQWRLAAAATLDELSAQERSQLLSAVAPGTGPALARWWSDGQERPYQRGWSRKGFRILGSPQQRGPSGWNDHPVR